MTEGYAGIWMQHEGRSGDHSGGMSRLRFPGADTATGANTGQVAAGTAHAVMPDDRFSGFSGLLDGLGHHESVVRSEYDKALVYWA